MRPKPSFAQTLLLLYLLAAVSPSSSFRTPQASFHLPKSTLKGVAKLGSATELPVMRTASRLRRGKLIEMTDPYADVLPASSSRKAWLFLPQVFVLLATATSPPKIHCLQFESGFYDCGGVRHAAYTDSVVIFECRADAERYAGLLRGQGIADLAIQAVQPRVVLVFAAQNGCKSAFSPAGTSLKPPDMRAEERAKFMYYGGGATASERRWIPPAAESVHKVLGGNTHGPHGTGDAGACWRRKQKQARPSDTSERKVEKTGDDNAADEEASGVSASPSASAAEQETWEAATRKADVQNDETEDENKMRLVAERMRDEMRAVRRANAGQPSPGKQWHFLPKIFVLVSDAPPAAAVGVDAAAGGAAGVDSAAPWVYTIKEQKGFYDNGMGHTSPAYVHSLLIFEDGADAERYAGLVQASEASAGGFTALRVQEVHPRIAFVFSVRAGIKISLVPQNTFLVPPRDDGPGNGQNGQGKVWSALDVVWRPEGKEVFDRSLLASMGMGDGIDYDDERRRLEQLFRLDD